jgi:mono/diheme cytochrome c family protein
MLVISLLALLGLSPDSGKSKTRGKAEYERICSACHPIGAGTANPRTRAQWAAVVDDMAAMGAAGTRAELKLIVDYLTANFGTK